MNFLVNHMAAMTAMMMQQNNRRHREEEEKRRKKNKKNSKSLKQLPQEHIYLNMPKKKKN